MSRLPSCVQNITTRSVAQHPASGKVARAACAAAILILAPIQHRMMAQETGRPAFEVASIKPGDPNERRLAFVMQLGGRVVATNVTLKVLMEFAYDVRDHQITGGPNWLDSARFSIEARAPESEMGAGGLPRDDTRFRSMVQSLLADRFQLAVHRETKDESIYNLEIAKGGPKLKASLDARPNKPRQMQLGRGQFTGAGAPMSLLASELAQQLRRTVIDKTGLSGQFDFTLQWTPDPPKVGAFEPPPAANAPPEPDPNGPTIFTALQEQLGLRLESAKGPVDMLIVDHAEKPSEN